MRKWQTWHRRKRGIVKPIIAREDSNYVHNMMDEPRCYYIDFVHNKQHHPSAILSFPMFLINVNWIGGRAEEAYNVVTASPQHKVGEKLFGSN